MCKVLNSNPL